MSAPASEILARFIKNLSLGGVPPEVIDKAKLHILDTIGIALGVYGEDYSRRIVNFARMFRGSPSSTILGYMERVFTPAAAMANSVIIHSVDYDDTHLGSAAHLSSVVIPTALAVAESSGSSGREFLEAVIAGYEVSSRIGLAAPGMFHSRGFHPTSVIGIFGATAAAGKLLRLSEEQLISALGIAGSLSSGILQSVTEGVQLKPLHPGFASFNGILAAMLAQQGFEGPKKVFEGSQGFLRAYLGIDGDRLLNLLDTLGRVWETMNISLKPYPACHASHSSIDIAIKLRNEYGVTPEDVIEYRCYIPKIAMELIAMPWDEKLRPSTPYSAKFSLPYLVITALRKGWVGLWEFTSEAIRDPEILKHMDKVRAEYEPRYDEYIEKGVIPARARVYTRDGKVYDEEVINHRGTPYNPLSLDDVKRKFVDNISRGLYREKGIEIIEKILSIDKISYIEDFINILKIA